jgi:pyruvyltransferase
MKTLRARWYWTREWMPPVWPNVGDALAPLILDHFLYARAVNLEEPCCQHVLSCGSVLEFVRPNDFVWGAGAIKEMPIPYHAGVRFAAVRGPLSRQCLIDSGYLPEEVPEAYGDPATLMPFIYAPIVKKRRRLGVVPHYVERDEVARLFGNSAHIINPLMEPEAFINELLSCERILSSSLHGYILAQAYGIPAEHFRLTDEIIGGDFKLLDYVLGREHTSPRTFLEALTSADLAPYMEE